MNSGPLKDIAAKIAEKGGGGGVVWLLAAVIITFILAMSSVENIEPGEVAVKVNNLTGSQSAVTRPGWTIRVPLLHSVHVLDAKPQTFLMTGAKNKSKLEVRELTVRANDGSNFHFTDTTIIFGLKGDEVVGAVRDAGLDNGFMTWMKPYARSILRDEFGRESTIDVSDPTTYGAAAERAKERLNKLLGPHGVQINQLVTPRPRFSDDYEHAIEERNALSNQLEVIKSNLDRAATQRERALAEVDQQKNKIIQEKRATLEQELARAVAAAAEAKREADTYAIGKVAEGQRALSSATQSAKELQGELAAKYQAKLAEVSAFRNQPVERVMERLGERLKGSTIWIQPWANDATPSRVKYEEVKP